MSKADVASERKDQIVRATVDCISKYGYHNFSMQDVAQAAGVSKGIIHYYFLNKDELMMSVLDKVAGDIERILIKDMEESSDPVKRLEIFISTCFQIVRKTKEYYQVNMDFWTQINQNEEIRKTIAAHYAKFRQTATQVIQDGIEKKVFKPVKAHEFASFMIAGIDGVSLQWLFDDKAFEYNVIAKETFRWILSAIKA